MQLRGYRFEEQQLPPVLGCREVARRRSPGNRDEMLEQIIGQHRWLLLLDVPASLLSRLQAGYTYTLALNVCNLLTPHVCLLMCAFLH